MASLQTTSPLLTTSGVLFTGVLRVFPSSYDPLFGPVKEILIVDGLLEESATLPDGEYCLQVLYGEMVGSTTAVACQMVGSHEGIEEVDNFIGNSVSFNTHIRNLAQTRRELDQCQTELEIATEDLQSFNIVQDELAGCQDLIIQLESEIEILQQQLDESMEVETEEAIRDKMATLKACKAQAILITRPEFELPKPPSMAMNDLISSSEPARPKAMRGSGNGVCGVVDKEQERTLKKQVRSTHFGLVRPKVLDAACQQSNGTSPSVIGAALRSRNRIVGGMRARAMEGRPVGEIQSKGRPDPLSISQKTDTIKQMMERLKESC